MQALVKILITVVLLLVLSGINMLIERGPEPSDFFYYNLISCLQVFILLGCIFLLITRPLFKRFFKKRLLLWQFIGYVAIITLLELGCSFMLSHPRSIPKFAMPAFSFYYDHFECRIIQYEPEYNRFDSALYYSLKNNLRFTYSNREYANEFATNSKGLRDDETSLAKPGIICLGDSYTLGWGADEQQSFPGLVEKQTGLKTLNAGMSSYGTARENKLLSMLDTSEVRYIIWQYCSNDADENHQYLQHNALERHTPKELDSVMELHAWTRKYFPGRHFFTISKLLVKQVTDKLPLPMRMAPAPPENDSEKLQQATDFVNIVTSGAINLSKTKLIVLDLSPYPLDSGFIRHVQKLANDRGLEASIITLDCNTFLTKEDFYVLDVHLTPEGNRKVGEALVKIINTTTSHP